MCMKMPLTDIYLLSNRLYLVAVFAGDALKRIEIAKQRGFYSNDVQGEIRVFRDKAFF